MAHIKRFPNIFGSRECTTFKNTHNEGLAKINLQDECTSQMIYWAHYEPNEVFSTFPFLDESRYVLPQVDKHTVGTVVGLCRA